MTMHRTRQDREALMIARIVQFRIPGGDCSGCYPRHDRAAVATTALLQILKTAPPHQQRDAIEDYLRDEFADVARTALNEIRLEDE